MLRVLRKKIQTPGLIKIAALIIGYALWYNVHHSTLQTMSLDIPLCFYNVADGCHLTESPAHVTVHIQGKAEYLRNMRTQDIAAHINAAPLKCGTQKILLSKNHLFLPDSAKLVHYDPSPLVVRIEKTVPSTP